LSAVTIAIGGHGVEVGKERLALWSRLHGGWVPQIGNCDICVASATSKVPPGDSIDIGHVNVSRH